MNIWKIKIAYYVRRLVEARRPLVILTAILAVIAVMTLWFAGRGDEDPWGHTYSDRSDIVCQSHGEGAVTCSPAPEGVRRYREKLRADHARKGD